MVRSAWVFCASWCVDVEGQEIGEPALVKLADSGPGGRAAGRHRLLAEEGMDGQEADGRDMEKKETDETHWPMSH